MALQLTDKFIISRSGVLKNDTLTNLINLITANIGTTEFKVADITARDQLSGLSLGDRVFVEDASNDTQVGTGWGIYTWNGTIFVLIAKEEALTVSAPGTNLTHTADTTSITLNSSTGTGTTLSGANTSQAGLLTVARLNELTTATTNITALQNSSHNAATAGGVSGNNPIVIDNNQVITFNIDQLDPA